MRTVKELVVTKGSSTFMVGGQCVELNRRAQLSRVLQVLADAHQNNPGEWIHCPELIRVAWEGERMRDASAMNRLHVAIATLRKLGFRPVLQSKRGAYRLRTDIQVTIHHNLQN
jgi:DNA-binding winged helix-turn-helix (wHTH) protein